MQTPTTCTICNHSPVFHPGTVPLVIHTLQTEPAHLQKPNAATGQDGGWTITWKRDDHILQLQISKLLKKTRESIWDTKQLWVADVD